MKTDLKNDFSRCRLRLHCARDFHKKPFWWQNRFFTMNVGHVINNRMKRKNSSKNCEGVNRISSRIEKEKNRELVQMRWISLLFSIAHRLFNGMKRKKINFMFSEGWSRKSENILISSLSNIKHFAYRWIYISNAYKFRWAVKCYALYLYGKCIKCHRVESNRLFEPACLRSKNERKK